MIRFLFSFLKNVTGGIVEDRLKKVEMSGGDLGLKLKCRP